MACMYIDAAWKKLTPIAAEQCGHFTTKQALYAGLSPTQLNRMKNSGRIEHFMTGSYQIAGAPQDGFTDIRAIWCHLINQTDWLGGDNSSQIPPIIFGYDTAAGFHGIGTIIARTADVIALQPVTPSSNDIVIKDTELRDRDWRWYDGIPMVTPVHTIVDQFRHGQDGDIIGRALIDVLSNPDHGAGADDLPALVKPYMTDYGFTDPMDMIDFLCEYSGYEPPQRALAEMRRIYERQALQNTTFF